MPAYRYDPIMTEKEAVFLRRLVDSNRTQYCIQPIRCPTLKKMADFISSVLGHRTAISKSYTNTDTNIAGTRLRRLGRGRRGNKIEVFGDNGEVIFRHDSSETYRNNCEVARWVIERCKTRGIEAR